MYKILLSIMLLMSSSLYAQDWEQKADAPAGRHHPISFSIDGKGYAVTGTGFDGEPSNEFFQYDPVSDNWSTLSDFPGPKRSFGIGVVNNDVAYLGFGADLNQYLNDFWKYDPETVTWTQLASCACSGRRHPAMLTIGNRIYLGLGDDAVGDLKDWWMYDIPSDSWSQIADLPGPPRHHPFMFNADGDIFVGLGHRGNNIYRDWYKLDTVSNVWNSMGIFPGEGRVAGTQLGNGKYGYVISGDGDNHSYMETGEMWRYDPSDDSWTELPPHPGISRWAPGSFVIENNVYFFGGLNRQTGTFPNDLWKFELEDEMVDTNSTSIQQNLSLANTFIYPNPTNDILMWEIDQKITDIKIFNALGKLVISASAITKQVDVKNLNDGLYLVLFYAEDQAVKTTKLYVNH